MTILFLNKIDSFDFTILFQQEIIACIHTIISINVSLFRFIPDGEHREYVAPGSCKNGTIDWNYPKEFVIIHFKRESNAQYSVCLGESTGGYMFTLYDVTGDKKQAIPKGVYVYVQF